MTDRELLEQAAKAAGLPELRGAGSQHHCYYVLDEQPTKWNPLTDDGDALRLAVHLRLMIAWDRWNDNDYVCIRHRDLDEEIGIQIDQSPEQTVRRAIVLAAAEIGSAMGLAPTITSSKTSANAVSAAEREACARAASIALLGADKSLSDRVLNAIRSRGQRE